MDYFEHAIKEIRERWFENHKIKKMEGQDGFQRIVWGEEGTSMYQVEYMLSGNMVFTSGDLGSAVFELTGSATIEQLGKYDLTYFTRKWIAGERNKFIFDGRVAAKQIEEYFKDWCDVEQINQLDKEDKQLFDELIEATFQWSVPEHFSNYVFHIYHSTELDWFDSECASTIADCGQKLSYAMISYWVGLQMIAELLKEKAIS